MGFGSKAVDFDKEIDDIHDSDGDSNGGNNTLSLAHCDIRKPKFEIGMIFSH